MQWNNEIVGLWPTLVMSSQLADESLIDKFAQLDADEAAADRDLFSIDDAAIHQLRTEIDGAVYAYFQRLEVHPVPAWRVRGRFERLSHGASQGLKNAPGAYLRGAFYIRAPKDMQASNLRSDARPGDLTLFDPRLGINMLSIKGDPYRNQALSVDPQPGLMLLWPAAVNDFRHPNLSDTEQLSVCIEVVPDDGAVASSVPAQHWSGNISETWPTGLVKRRLPQFDEPNRELIRLIDELERDNPNLTTDFNTNRFKDRDHPAVAWLMSHINQSVDQYFKQFEMNYPISWDIAIWSNINRFGDYHSPHTHPWSYLSGTYYVQVPDETAGQDYQTELPPACISFRDPRSTGTSLAYPQGSRFGPNYTIQPVPGAMLMWPSAVFHFVHPNLSTQKRYSISFNIHLQTQPHFF